MKRLALLVIVLLCHGIAQAQVREIKTTYALLKGTFKLAEVTEIFSIDNNNRYHIESIAKPILSWLLPTLTQTASGTVGAEGLRPEHFKQTIGNKPEKTLLADFNWDTSELVLNVRGEIKKHELKPLTFDSLSLKYQFMFSPPDSDGTILLTDGKKVEEYAYRLMKDQWVTTPAGKYETLHVAKIVAPDEAKFELWLGKQQHYVPVKVLAQNEENKLEQVLTKIVIDEVTQK